MLSDVTDLLRCPHDGDGLAMTTGDVLGCRSGHRFDLGRGGYVNLSVGRSVHSADTTEMVLARERAQQAGVHDEVTASLASVVRDLPGIGAKPVVIDAGAGTGQQLARVLDTCGGRGLALEASVPAARRAARAHPGIGSVVTDIWSRLPVHDDAADLVLNVFAPRNAAEFARVLRPTGALVVVSPSPQHLQEARDLLGLLDVDRDKPERLQRSLEAHFRFEGSSPVRTTVLLDHAGLLAVAGMGPTAAHSGPREWAARLDQAPEHVEVRIATDISLWSVRDAS